MKKLTAIKFALLAIFAGLLLTASTQAANYTVTTTADSGAGSLRNAITTANGTGAGDTIDFNIPAASCPSGICTITLASEIVISSAGGALTINGTGAKSLTIDGGPGTNRIFFSNGASFTVRGVTLTGGNGTGGASTGLGGAIYANGGTLILDSVYVNGNTTTGNTVGGGVAVFGSSSSTQIVNSTISNNTSQNECGGIVNSQGSMSITNSTISGNRSIAAGAGGICSDGNLTMRSVTITNNTAATSGGGMLRNNGRTVNLGNTIIAGNTAPSNPDINFTGGAVVTSGYNLIGNNSSVAATFPAGNPNANNDIVGTSAAPINPMLNALSNNGGQTPTHMPSMGSPVIDKGNSTLTTDQRGFMRPVDDPNTTNAVGGNGSDIGSFEVQTFVQDQDNDGINDSMDNCPNDANPNQEDNDLDMIGDACDDDDDNDGVLDVNDAFPFDANESVDTDGDGIGNNTDTDDDNDGQSDADEITCGSDPLDATSKSSDNDGDNSPDCVDTDDDNDGVLDGDDAFPFDPTESVDTDGDGIGNNADTDDDNDGQLDTDELACGSDPLDAASQSPDADGDNSPDCVDPDDDNDGIPDVCDIDQNPGAEDFDRDGIVDGSGCDTEIGPPTDKDQCKDGGWMRFNTPAFRNQGQCVSYVNGRRP